MFRAVVIVASIALLGTTSAVPPSLLRSDAPALQVDTSIRPVTEDRYQLLRRATPGMYRCSVVVHDEPGSRRVWATKDIVLAAGESGEETAIFGPLQLHFRASLGEKLDRAETNVTVTRDGRIVSRQTSTVWLQRTSSASRPD
jgi:hypothetical protein